MFLFYLVIGALQIFFDDDDDDDDDEHVSHVALRSGMIFTVWTQSWTYPFLSYNVLLLIRCNAVTLTFDPLILKVRSTSGVCDQTLYQIWAKSNNPLLRY